MQSYKQDETIPFELEALSRAENYQKWIYKTVDRFVGTRILEIGAGIGNMSKWFPVREKLILSENDPYLMVLLEKNLKKNYPASNIKIQQLDISSNDLSHLKNENLDTIISFNVLEHIDNDKSCLRNLCQIMRESGAGGKKRLITFVPAHPWAFGTIDEGFGHYRRYSKSMVLSLCHDVAPDAKLHIEFFNIWGLIPWFLTGRILKSRNLGVGSIQLFNFLCPLLGPIDQILHKIFKVNLGQSLLFVLEWPEK